MKSKYFPLNKSVNTKLLVFFLTVAILPLLTLCYFSTNKSSEIVNKQFGNYGLYAVDQLKLHLDASLKQMDNISGNILTYLISSSIVIDDHEPATYSEYTEEKGFKRYMSSFENTNILSVNVVTPSGKFMGNDGIVTERLLNSDFWQQASLQSGKRILIHHPDYYSSAPAGDVISLILPIKDHYGLPAQSKILIDMKADSIMSLLKAFEDDTKSHLQVRNLDGGIVLQTSASYVSHANDIVWSKQLESENWVVEASIPYPLFFESSRIILKYSLFIAVMSLVLGLVMAGFFSFQITKPIKKMAQSMRRFGQGELSIQTPIYASDELGYLGETFNRMTGQIRDLIDEISTTEKLKSEAELKALHYQINPHLLFNTLNSIQWKARLAGQTDILKMLEHLVAVLEGSFNVKQVLVPLHTELEIIHHYLQMQRYRYGDVFTYSLQIEPGLEERLVPRMVLQPLFENIFFHGFIDGQGHITFTISSKDNHIHAEIVDDGMGIRAEHMAFVSSGQVIPGKTGGLGMRNVDERFKHHFGEPYGLVVHSERNKGTKVKLKWPKTL